MAIKEQMLGSVCSHFLSPKYQATHKGIRKQAQFSTEDKADCILPELHFEAY